MRGRGTTSYRDFGLATVETLVPSAVGQEVTIHLQNINCAMCSAEAWAGTDTWAHPARVFYRQFRGRTLPTCESSSSSSSKVKARNLELCQYSSSSARTLLICNDTARLPQQREGAAASGVSPPPPLALVPAPPPAAPVSPRRPSRGSSSGVLTARRGRTAARGARRHM